MAGITYYPGQVVTFEAEAAVKAGNVVYLSSVGKVKKTDGARNDVVGVALNDAEAGELLEVLCWGRIKVIAAGAISLGARIVSAADGKVQAAASLSVVLDYVKGTATTYVPDDSTIGGVSLAASGTLPTTESGSVPPGGVVIGLALEAATADGDEIEVLFAAF